MKKRKKIKNLDENNSQSLQFLQETKKTEENKRVEETPKIKDKEN